MTFLPDSYKIPVTASDYMRFSEGLNQIRILSSAIVGWEYFTKENKPVRQREEFEDMPTDIKVGGKVKPFWAFVVWNYQESRIQILELTQKTVMTAIKSLVDNPKWGDPKNYDIAITKIGTTMADTEYNVQGEPPIQEPSEEIKVAFSTKYVKLEALFEGADPFTH